MRINNTIVIALFEVNIFHGVGVVGCLILLSLRDFIGKLPTNKETPDEEHENYLREIKFFSLPKQPISGQYQEIIGRN